MASDIDEPELNLVTATANTDFHNGYGNRHKFRSANQDNSLVEMAVSIILGHTIAAEKVRYLLKIQKLDPEGVVRLAQEPLIGRSLTVLQLTLQKNNEEIIAVLLNDDTRKLYPASDLYNALHVAVRTCSPPMVHYVIKNMHHVFNRLGIEGTVAGKRNNILISACMAEESCYDIIKMLIEHDFTLGHIDKSHTLYGERGSSAYYGDMYRRLAALSNPKFMIACYRYDLKTGHRSLDEMINGNDYGQEYSYHREYDDVDKALRAKRSSRSFDPTLIPYCFSVIQQIDHAAQQNYYMYEAEYTTMRTNVEEFMKALINFTKPGYEGYCLMKVNRKTLFQDNYQVLPLLKQCVDMNCKRVTTAKPCLGIIKMLVNKDQKEWPQNEFLLSLFAWTAAIMYPMSWMICCLMPHSQLARLTKYPKIMLYSTAVSEIYTLILIILYDDLVVYSNPNSYYFYHGGALVFAFALAQRELADLWNTSLSQYLGDQWNWIDGVEALLLTMTCLIRLWLPPYYADYPEGAVIPEYPRIARFADGCFASIPIFIMIRMLMLLRITRTLGSIQISFSKMASDVWSWASIVAVILIGYGISLTLFTKLTLKNGATYAVKGTDCENKSSQFHGMAVTFYQTMGTIFWVMMNGADGHDIADCYGYDPLLHCVCYFLLASFSVIVVVVMVNLLVAMMSKTYDTVVEAEVREAELSFYMTATWLKFIRHEFVDPIPLNLCPYIYRCLARMVNSVRWMIGADLVAFFNHIVMSCGLTKTLNPGVYEMIMRKTRQFERRRSLLIPELKFSESVTSADDKLPSRPRMFRKQRSSMRLLNDSPRRISVLTLGERRLEEEYNVILKMEKVGHKSMMYDKSYQETLLGSEYGSYEQLNDRYIQVVNMLVLRYREQNIDV